jgi:hypothetical protein
MLQALASILDHQVKEKGAIVDGDAGAIDSCVSVRRVVNTVSASV